MVLVLTTVSSDVLADEIATTLVTEHLAACVNIGGPMTSVYRWKGTVERETERQLVIKTSRNRVAALRQRLKELHPYELPEFIVIEAGASDEYLAWVNNESHS